MLYFIVTELKCWFLRLIYILIPLRHSSPRAQRERPLQKGRARVSASAVREAGCKTDVQGWRIPSPSTGEPINSPKQSPGPTETPELKANLLIGLVSTVSLKGRVWRARFQPSNGRWWEKEKMLGCALTDDIGIARYFLFLSYHFLFPEKWTAILPHSSTTMDSGSNAMSK